LKTSRYEYLQMLFSAVTHPAEGLRLETLLTLKVEMLLICLIGCMETDSIHSRTTVNFVPETLIRNKASRFCRPE
jgi:hypothetical protein